MQRVLSVVAIALVGVGAGFGIGRWSAPSAEGAPGARVTVGGDAGSALGVASGPAALGAPGARAEKGEADSEPISFQELVVEFQRIQQLGWMGTGSIREMSRIVDRLEVSDLAGLCAQLLAEPQVTDRMPMVQILLNAYAEANPDAAWQLVSSAPTGPMRQAALSTVVGAIAQRDPQAALDLYFASVQSGSPMSGHDNLVMTIFHHWAAQDVEAAKAAAARLSGPAQEQAMSSLLVAYARRDPEGAWSYVQTLPRTAQRFLDPRLQVLSTWASTDPRAAMQAASLVSDPAVRDVAMSSAISSWARNDMDAALSFVLATESSTLRSDMFRSLALQSRGNREKVLTAVLDYMPPGNSFQQAVGQIMSGWAQEDPTAAAEAVLRLPPGQILSTAAAHVAQNWVRSGGRAEALAWAQRLPEGEPRLSSVDAVFRQWAADDPLSAQAALSTLTDKERSRALRAIAEGWSQRDPEAVVRWAKTLGSGGETQDVLQKAIAIWARSAPEAAARAMSQVPESGRGPAMEALVRAWAEKDAIAAGNWLKNQPAAPVRDGAISALAQILVREDPEAALAWAAQLTDESNRERQLARHARTWLNNEPQAARLWISSSRVLSPETRDKLLQR